MYIHKDLYDKQNLEPLSLSPFPGLVESDYVIYTMSSLVKVQK